MGSMLAYLSYAMTACSNPLIVETFALWRGLDLGAKLGFLGFEVQMERDAQTFIHTLNEVEKCWSWFGNLVEDIKLRIKQLPGWAIRFIHKEGNQVAHYLAKYGLLLRKECIWIDEYSGVIAHYVLQDISIQ